MKSRDNENKSYLNELIQKGNLNQAINEMLSQKRKTIKEKLSYLKLLHYSNKLARLNRENNLGTITTNDYDTKYNKITYAVIKIINQKNIKQSSTLKNWRYGIIILIIGGLILSVILFFYNSKIKTLELKNKEASSTNFFSLEKEKNEGRIFELASSGFGSTVRLAKSSPDMWVPIFRQNRDNVLFILDEYIETLSKFRSLLIKKDFEQFYQLIEEANNIKKIIK